MQGQHSNTTIVKIVQEDFVKTPGRNAVVEVLDDTEGVSETWFIRNVCVGGPIFLKDRDVPSGREIRGLLKLLRVCLIIGVKECFKNRRRHGIHHPGM